MNERGSDMEDVATILADAQAAVKLADIEEDLRSVAFSKAFEAIMAERMGAEYASKGMSAVVPAAPTPIALRAADADDLLQRIADRLRIDRGTAAEVFAVEGDHVDIIVTARRLDSGRSPATRQIATLVVAARQGAGLEEWTDADHVRRMATDFNRYDQANFASTVKEMDGVFGIKQNGRKILLRMSRPGWEQARDLVVQLSGEEQSS